MCGACVCACVFVCVCEYVCVCVFVYVCVCTCMSWRTCTCVYLCVSVCVREVHMCQCLCAVQVHACMHAGACACARARACAYALMPKHSQGRRLDLLCAKAYIQHIYEHGTTHLCTFPLPPFALTLAVSFSRAHTPKPTSSSIA